MYKTESKEPPSAQTHMDLGPGGGCISESTNPTPQSHYWEVKNQEDDAPPKLKRGVTRQDNDGNAISDDVVWMIPWWTKVTRILPTTHWEFIFVGINFREFRQ